MSYSVNTIQPFDKQLKRLVKKYPSLKKELYQLGESLKTDPFQGTSLGNHCYKIRLAIASKGKGKSGGARVITHIFISQKTVFLLSIYDKSEQVNIDNKELLELIGRI